MSVSIPPGTVPEWVASVRSFVYLDNNTLSGVLMPASCTGI
jgi:hypothetical protein